MGCRCCKMIQSYLFDPVQVPSPGYINEVNNCKLDEDDNVKFKGRTSSQALVPKTEPPSEGVKRTASRSADPAAAAAATASPRSDPGQDPSADKTWGSSNGVGPAPALQPAEGGPQDGRGSWASTENGVHPSQPFLEGQDVGGPDRGSPAWEATPGILNGDSSIPELGLQLPAPDYPAPWRSAAAGAENDRLCPGPSDDGHPQPPVHPTEPAVDPAAVSPQTCRDALGTDALSLRWKDADPAPPGPLLADWGNGWAEAEADEDAAVAEALAALEAATAGEDVDEAE